ncbi:MAG: MFS transporter, partial [Alphaproteobacteria bacterium]|nr:MFS transporter [Alphaproteobacteria bacterium]
NFADKVVVGLAAQPITQELGLTPEQFGLIGSSFFFLFAISAVIVGFVANRMPTRRLLLVMAIVWSLVQFPMLGTVTLELLIACRIILGAGEGPAGPVVTHAAYKWFPDSRRGLPTAIIAQGSAFGVIVAVPALNWIIVHYSWHWAFGALGIAGLLWAALWLVLGREGTLVDTPKDNSALPAAIPYRYLFTCPSIVAATCTCFAAYWGLSMGLTWFTSYLIRGLGYNQTVAGNLTVVPWLLGATVLLIGGAISQRLTANGTSSRIARGLFPSATVFLGGCMLPFIGNMPSPEAKFGLLVLGSAIGSTIYVVVPMIVSELTPQPQRGAMLAITNSLVTLAGVASPFVMGRVIQNAAAPGAGYEHGYLILGCLMIAGSLIGMLFIRPDADRKRLIALAGAAAIKPANA